MLFNKIYSADYSGGGENHQTTSGICLCEAKVSSDPDVKEITPAECFKKSQLRRWSRDDLTRFTKHCCDTYNASKERCLFTWDAQFSWPALLWKSAGLSLDTSWREALKILKEGHKDGLPPLDRPKRYCHKFNHFVGRDIFWTNLKKQAQRYDIPNQSPHKHDDPQRFRMCEKSSPFPALAENPNWGEFKKCRPMPSDAVGGQGIGSVGGQTVCALRQFADLIETCPNLAFWPLDGLDINDPVYHDRHVIAEMHCALTLPLDKKKSDFHDAFYACRAFAKDTADGQMEKIMNLNRYLSPQERQQVRREGWILGMKPHQS